MKTIAERLKEGMELRQLKQVDIIEKTGINKGALSSYISGKYEPKQNNIYLLAKALNVNEAWLMGHDVPMERNVLKFDTAVDDTPYNRALQKLQNKEELSEDELLAFKKEFPQVIKAISKSFQVISDTIDDANKKRLISSYEKLNSDGKIEALKRVDELTFIPNYCEKTPLYLQPVAAHNDYADDDEEQRLMQEDLENL